MLGFSFWARACMHSKMDLPRGSTAYHLLVSTVIVVYNWTTRAMPGKFVGVVVMWHSQGQYARWPAGQRYCLLKLGEVLEQLFMKWVTVNNNYFIQTFKTVVRKFWFFSLRSAKRRQKRNVGVALLLILASAGQTKSHWKISERQFCWYLCKKTTIVAAKSFLARIFTASASFVWWMTFTYGRVVSLWLGGRSWERLHKPHQRMLNLVVPIHCCCWMPGVWKKCAKHHDKNTKFRWSQSLTGLSW